MSFRVRPAHDDDLDALYEMAKLTGGGFTNLPPDRGALEAKLARSIESFAKQEDVAHDDLYLLVLENTETAQVRGTAQIFARIGELYPFYSYRIGMFSQVSQALNRTFRAQTLTLTTDLEGSAEVGGLFLHPRERAGGLGALLARSRYLFIAAHRARIGNQVVAELRGVIDEAGGSPFWDGLAGRFFGISFQEADEFNAINGYQFIADLMPKHPIYTAMLTDSARAVIGLPHPNGRAAMRMLEAEGFHQGSYVDIFDGGPTMSVATDRLRTVAEARRSPIAAIGGAGRPAIAATGRLDDFRAALVTLGESGGGVTIGAEDAALLGVAVGDALIHVPR